MVLTMEPLTSLVRKVSGNIKTTSKDVKAAEDKDKDAMRTEDGVPESSVEAGTERGTWEMRDHGVGFVGKVERVSVHVLLGR